MGSILARIHQSTWADLSLPAPLYCPQHLWAEVYDRKPPYHPSQDSIVRTEARRLRTKLKPPGITLLLRVACLGFMAEKSLDEPRAVRFHREVSMLRKFCRTLWLIFVCSHRHRPTRDESERG